MSVDVAAGRRQSDDPAGRADRRPERDGPGRPTGRPAGDPAGAAGQALGVRPAADRRTGSTGR